MTFVGETLPAFSGLTVAANCAGDVTCLIHLASPTHLPSFPAVANGEFDKIVKSPLAASGNPIVVNPKLSKVISFIVSVRLYPP